MDLERAAARHWRGTEEEWLGGWLLRAAEGFTGRANSVLPLGDPERPLDDALAAVTSWYRARGLPPMVSVPMPAGKGLDTELTERFWLTRPGPAFVMTTRLTAADVPALPAGMEVRVDDKPDDEWLRMHRYRGQANLPPVRLRVLMSAQSQAFVSVRSRGEAVAVGRLSIADGWAGITAVEVDPAHRRHGLGTAVTRRICAEAVARGICKVFLQVETGNAGAISLYERCGFRQSHAYHYRVAPA